MIEKIFIFLLAISPKLKKFLWKRWYQILANYKKDSTWKFMNYGFIDSKIEIINLDLSDEPDRESIQLYHHVASKTTVENKTILEVGSGRGGGASFIAKFFNPFMMFGIDISPNAVRLSNNFYNQKNLNFKVGDSENIPFPDNYFDVVINVESSHCYGSMEKFLLEVKRVLKPGGYFSWADLDGANMERFNQNVFLNSGMKIISEEIITENVLAGLDSMSDKREKAIIENTPKLFLNSVKTFAGVKGTEIYNSFKNGKMVYLSKLLQK